MEKVKSHLQEKSETISCYENINGNYSINGRHYTVKYKWADENIYKDGINIGHRYCNIDRGILEEI